MQQTADFPDVSWCELVGKTKYINIEPMLCDDPRGREYPPIVIAPGFPFEVSSPFFARMIVSPHDRRLLRAALFHDFALHRMRMEREYADPLLYRIAIDDGSPEWRARLIYWAADKFGWRPPSKKAVQSA